METKDQITVVLKEYDALRKEIDDRVNTPKVYFVPLLFVSLAGVLGWKAEAPFDLILLLIFPLFLAFLSFALNANYYLQRAARHVAKLEDKVFRLSGLSLLTHETEIIHLRQQFPVRKAVFGGALICILYLILEGWLFYELNPTRLIQLANYPAKRLILLSLLLVPLLMFVFSGIRLMLLHRTNLQFRSTLLDELISNNFDYLISFPEQGFQVERAGKAKLEHEH